VGISDNLVEKLNRLDNFQRAEFLRRREVHSECETRISELSKRAYERHQKSENDDKSYGQFISKYGWFVAVVVILELIFDRTPLILDALAAVVAVGFWGFAYIVRRLDDNHDAMLFEMFALEKERYEYEKRVNCRLSPSHPDNENLILDILQCLGFHSGLVGGGFKADPLKPVK